MLNSVIKRVRQKRQFYTWVLSYILLLVVSLLISSHIYTASINIIEEEVKRATEGTLSKIKGINDADFQNIQTMAYKILNIQYINNLITTNNTYTNAEISDMSRDISSNITASMMNIKYVEDVIVLLSDRDMCMDSSGMYKKSVAYEKGFKDYYATQGAWLKDMFEINGFGEFKILRSLSGGKKVVLVRKYPIVGKMPAKAIAIITIDSQSITKSLESIPETYKAQIYILNQEQEVLFGAGDYDKLDTNPDLEQNSFVGKNQFITHIKSLDMGWEYVMVLPTKEYLSKVRSVKNITIFSYIICLIVGISMAVFFSKLNYKPVSSIITKLQGVNTSQSEEYGFGYIENTLSNMVEDRRKMQAEILDNKEKLKETFLVKLVTGKIRFDKHNEPLFKEYKIDAYGGKYVVIIFNVIDNGLWKEPGADFRRHGINLIFFTISNVFSELMGRNGDCSYFELDDMYGCIAYTKGDFLEEMALKNAETTSKFLKDKFEIEMVCAISRIGNGGESLPELFLQAKEIISMRFYISGKPVLSYGDRFDNTDGVYDYSLGTEMHLTNLIKKGDLSKAQDVLENIFEENFIKRKTDISITKVLTHDILSTLLKLSVEIYPNGDNRLLPMMEKVTRAQNMEETKKLILNCTSILCEGFAVKNETVTEKILQIIALIHERYGDPDLNVGYIANEFNITINYLSRYFKEQTGEGLLDYIIKYRIEKACELFQKGTITVAEAGRQCSFENTNVFIRAFKKVTGVTPGQYKG